MQPRLSLITLGVADVARARKFYEALGFKAGSASQDSVTFLDAGGVVLALFGRASLAEDAGVADSTPDLTPSFSASRSPIMPAAKPTWIKRSPRPSPPAPS